MQELQWKPAMKRIAAWQINLLASWSTWPI